MWFCSLFSHLPPSCSWHGLYEFVAVPDLQESVEDVHIDQMTTAVLAATEDLVRDRDDAVHRDRSTDPVVTASILKGP